MNLRIRYLDALDAFEALEELEAWMIGSLDALEDFIITS